MTVIFKHVRTGHLVARPEPDDEPVRRRQARARDIAKLDASPMWERVESGGGAEGEFNPADHTVAEVLAHLADADEEERSRVLGAEAEGKGRRGILQGPHADLSGV